MNNWEDYPLTARSSGIACLTPAWLTRLTPRAVFQRVGGASETGGEFKKFMAILAAASGVGTVPGLASSPLGAFAPATCSSGVDCGRSALLIVGEDPGGTGTAGVSGCSS